MTVLDERFDLEILRGATRYGHRRRYRRRLQRLFPPPFGQSVIASGSVATPAS